MSGASARTGRGPCPLPGLLAALMGMASGAAHADVQLAGIFSDHMVLQRQMPVRVWGRATPGEAVAVALADRRGQARTGADGRWQVTLPALPAGGPHQLVVQGRNRLVLTDILMGELWLASGQSNMEWPLKWTDGADAELAQAAAADQPIDPLIRHVKLPHRALLRPDDDLPAQAWQRSTPQQAAEFSAVAWHFARRLRRELGVPVGLVNNAWGGTHIETWTSPRAALADADLAPTVRSLPASPDAMQRQRLAQMTGTVQRWQPGVALDPAGATTATPSAPNAAPTADTNADTNAAATGGSNPSPATPTDAQPDHDDRRWRTLQQPGIWEGQGLPGVDGAVWLRQHVELTEAQASGPATLHLGMVDDCDETWLNGQRVGGLCGWDTPRHWPVPAGLLKPGRNVVAVRVTDTGGGGGLHGDAAAVRLDTAAGSLPLPSAWRARVATVAAASEVAANDAPTLAFNGMLRPLLPLRLRGVLWYQGESNVGRAAAYAGAFQRLIVDWRRQFNQPALGFYFVQLAAYLPLDRNSLAGSAWAELRDAQRQALALPHTGMVVATDVGDADDIHPRRKQPVGQRLAGLVLRGELGRPIAADGPVLRQVQRSHGAIRLRFGVSDALLALRGADGRPHLPGSARGKHDGSGPGPTPQGFAIADASGQFKPAQARIHGAWVQLWRDDMPNPQHARYAWVDNPQRANLVSRLGLPASPFRTDRLPLQTANARYAP